MTALPPDALADLYKLVAELEQRLESSFVAHDAAIARQAATDAENTRLINELGIARERQNASADILSTIANASGDAEGSLQRIAETTARLFDAASVTIRIADGDKWGLSIRFGAGSERIGKEVPAAQLEIGARNLPSAVFALNQQIHVPDLTNLGPDMADWPGLVTSRAAGLLTVAGTPLRREGKPIGILIIYRDRLAPFSDEELALQQSFADQAVIAIENARLFNETKEALERQTATAEILKVIAASPSDAQPVFEAIAASSKRLLGGFSATVLRFLGDELHLVAYTPTNPAADEGLKASFPRSISEFPTFALVRNGETVQFPDSEAEHVPQLNKDLARLRGFRSVLFTPLMNQGAPVGMISVTRAEPGAFAADHVQLLQTFADQAVIAIENARLFNETRQALERQTATADVLKVIAGSPSDVRPVFDAIVVGANRLIGGFSTAIFRYADGAIHLAAFTPTDPAGDAVLQSSFPVPFDKFPPYHLVHNGAPAELPDTELEPAARDIARARGYRSMLFAPLMNEGKAVGIITVTRRAPGPFDAPHVQLLQMFAAQSVIAIENVRLFNETQEALEQQKASADILRVVSNSVADAQPVFDEILRSIEHLFGGDDRFIYLAGHDGLLHIGAAHGTNAERVRALYPVPLEGTASEVAFRERRLIRYADVFNDPEVPAALREVARRIGTNYSMALAPMLWEDRAIGSIFVGRTSMKPFNEKECGLLRSFADQAVIAIQNARLFNETREALERQTATADILKVIASSPSDTTPVFEAIAHSAKRLLGGFSTAVFRLLDGIVHLAAFTPTNPTADEALKADFPQPVENFEAFRLAGHGEPIAIPDTEQVSHAPLREIARLHGFRSMLWVPMVHGGVTTGIISVTRVETGAFAPHHVQLLQTFADQAVIAIENARLFDEVKQRTEDLSESLQQQTATADVLKVISRAAFDLPSVLDTLVSSAALLCGDPRASIYLLRDGLLHLEAAHNNSAEWIAQRRSHPMAPSGDTPSGRAALTGQLDHVPDLLADPEFSRPDLAQLGDYRATLNVPMTREGVTVGVLSLARPTPGPFTQRQIELVQTFADQAVIAIENVRLFDEVEAKTRDLTEALEYQTAIGDVLNVISRSPNNLQPVIETIVHTARRLCQSEYALMLHREGDGVYRIVAHSNASQELMEWMQDNPVEAGDGSAVGIVVAEKQTVHLPDALADPRFTDLRRQRHSKARTMLGVPLLRGQEVIGVVFLARTEVNPFSDKQIDLVTNFADQAVIAIENVRLFDEVQSRTRDLTEALTYQTGSANILRVIASSPTDISPVLQAIVESACEICGAHDAVMRLKQGDDLRFSAHHGPLSVTWNDRPISRDWTAGRAVIEGKPVQIKDLLSAEGDDFPEAKKLGQEKGQRTILSVPLLRDGESLGVITLRRLEVNPFEEKQISLLQTFADQAVIAIGNVRLFEEVQQRTRELSESLEQQTATSEVLSVISRSAGDLEPVFQSMLENATRICGAQFGLMNLYDGDSFHTVGFHNVPPAFEAARKQSFRVPPHSDLAQIVTVKKFVHIHDLHARPAYIEGDPATRQLADLAGARTILIVPMLKDDELVGTIGIYRLEVSPFNEKQIALLNSFASQAVIAIENTRLLRELRARTDDLTRSLDDLRTAQDRLVQTEKLASLGQLTAGIAHEIKNPLNFVNNFAALSAELTDELNDVLKATEISDKIREEVNELTGLLKDNLQKVVQHGQRADSIVKNMLLHSREGSGDHQRADINALIDESLNLAYHGARAEKPGFNVTLQRDFDPEAGMIELFPQEITRVFLNLVSNGFYAVAKRRNENGDAGFDPVLRATTRNLGDSVEIRIRDNGTGIPPEVKDKMFNPFFTTKPAGEGTGLGLSMSHDIVVKQHGGTIEVDTEPGQFTEFRIVLPRTGNSTNKNRGQT